ncbi:hypothetical protein F2Q70_00015128 [Brassica cretica]|uniref:Uncharacterized protein n=1 Tax=Brassica cretica TaxID=69181 RepID=A0A8S9KTW8_BRACR|nr:hypothetical protein F2Q70_00015128 [Brassica cretica]KAF2597985.1 hypothetical protein F2Q68_00008203 [Brassica cretica]
MSDVNHYPDVGGGDRITTTRLRVIYLLSRFSVFSCGSSTISGAIILPAHIPPSSIHLLICLLQHS